MIFRIVLLSFLIAIIVVLFFPLYVFINFFDHPSIEIKFLFLKFKINERERKVKVEEKVVYKDENKGSLKDILGKKGISGFISLIKDIACASSLVVKKLLKYLKVDKFDLNIIVRSEDAASTAMKYGTMCATVYPLIGVLSSKMNMKNHRVSITHDFQNRDEKNSSVSFESTFHISIGRLILIAMSVLKEYIKRKKELKR